MSVERKLAAIMFTDIAGYTEEMSKSEPAAISLLNKKESILKPLIQKHNGHYVKSTGDGSLSYFNSAVEAALCAKKLQESIFDDENLNIRVGVHLGDTIFENGDIRGDGVNVASRLENMAISGSVFVSKEVYDQLVNQPEFDGISLGVQSLKGVGRLIEVFGLKGDKLSVPDPEKYKNTQISIHEDEETPSVAIIPLKNKGADEDIFYAYGISADLIKECSAGGKIRVESLDNIETVENYDKYSAQELASKLSVRYISTGSLWKMGEMFQLSIELYDTVRSQVVWSDRWQENWDNLTVIKGHLSDGLLKVLDTKKDLEYYLESTNPEAYEYYLKAKYKFEKRKNTDDIETTRSLLQQALGLDVNMLSANNLYGKTYLETGDYNKAMEHFSENLSNAESQGNEAFIAHSLSNIGLVYQRKGEYLESIENYLRSYTIRSKIGDRIGMSYTLGNMAIIYHKRGEYNKALEQFQNCLEIQEDLEDISSMASTLNNIANIYLARSEFDKALSMFQQSLEISKEDNDNNKISILEGNIANIHTSLGDYNKALDKQRNVLKLKEALGDKRAIASTKNQIGINYHYLDKLKKALEYYNKAKIIRMEIEDLNGLAHSLFLIGIIYENLSHLDKAREFFEKSLEIQKNIGLKKGSIVFETQIYLHILNKKSGRPYDKELILDLIEQNKAGIDYVVYYRLYNLLEDFTYLKSAKHEVEKISSKLSEPDIFINLTIPKAILDESKNLKYSQ